MELLNQPGGSVWVTNAPNWTGSGGGTLKIAISPNAIKTKAEHGLRFMIGQMYGVLAPGMIFAEHVFLGLKRDMLVGDDAEAAAKKLAVTWTANRDAMFAGDPHDGRLQYLEAPKQRVFAVYVSPNEMLERFPEIHGWAEHWTWIAAEPTLTGAPVEWDTRYDRKLWSRPG